VALVIDWIRIFATVIFLDEIYDLKGAFAKYRPKKLNNPKTSGRSSSRSLQRLSAKPTGLFHQDPMARRRDRGRQEGGFNMKRRVADNDKEGIDKQIIFPTRSPYRRWSPAISASSSPAATTIGCTAWSRVTRIGCCRSPSCPLASLKRWPTSFAAASESSGSRSRISCLHQNRTIEEEASFRFTRRRKSSTSR